MQKHTMILAGIFSTLAALAAPVALSQSLNCAALSNSPLVEPAGYAQQCAFTPSANVVQPVPQDPTDLAYVWNFRTPNQGLNTHPLNNMATGLVNLGNPVPAISPFGIDFNPAASTLFGVVAVGAPQTGVNLVTLSLTNGAPTVVAPVSGAYPVTTTPTDIVINPLTGAAFISNATDLFTINLATGVTTLVGNMVAAPQVMIDLAINCQGQMFGHNINDDSLYSVNTTTGAATRIGGHGLAASFAQGMDFDNEDGLLYAWVYTGGGTYTYGTFNLTTGALTPLNANTPSGEYEGAIRNSCAPVGGADLALTQSNNAPAVLAIGTTFQKTLTTTNNGPSTATGITVTDTLPAQLTFVSSNCGATAAGQVVTYTIATLANAAVNNCAITVTVASSGTIVNTASITASSPADPVAANNTTTAQIGPTGGAPPPAASTDLALTQSNNAAGNALLVGSTFQKTLTVTNNGPGAATAITVTDTLPAQLAFVSSNCGATAAGQVVTWTIPTLAVAASTSCVLTVRVAASGTIVNTAAITAQTPPDSTPGNNTTTAQIGPTGGGIAQTAVPALDLNSVLVLLGLVSALGMLALRQRQA